MNLVKIDTMPKKLKEKVLNILKRWLENENDNLAEEERIWNDYEENTIRGEMDEENEEKTEKVDEGEEDEQNKEKEEEEEEEEENPDEMEEAEDDEEKVIKEEVDEEDADKPMDHKKHGDGEGSMEVEGSQENPFENSREEPLEEKLEKANGKVYKWMAGIEPNEIGQTIGEWDKLSLLKMVEMADQECREYPEKFVLKY
jgi:hypothetical protein